MDQKIEKEFEQLKKQWIAFSKNFDKQHWEKFSQELGKFKNHLKNLKF